METETTIPDRKRQRSARRLRHEAKAALFSHRAGDLEAIRQKLELRPAQICDLLRVHPSAWIRWTRTGRVPPHVFQMLEWYLELQRFKRNQSGEAPNGVWARSNSFPEEVPGSEPVVIAQSAAKAPFKTTFSPLIVTWILQGLMFVLILGLILKDFFHV